jgi:hypothetical protein
LTSPASEFGSKRIFSLAICHGYTRPYINGFAWWSSRGTS